MEKRLFFWPHQAAYRILVPRPRIQPKPWAVVLTSGPPGKSQERFPRNRHVGVTAFILTEDAFERERGKRQFPLSAAIFFFPQNHIPFALSQGF